MKRTSTYITCVILTVFLIFSCILAILAGSVRFRMLNTGAVLPVVTEQQLANKVSNTLQTEFKAAESASGIPASVYADAITPDKLEPMIADGISNGFAYLRGDTAKLEIRHDFSELDDQITAFFEDYAAKHNVIKDDTYHEAVKTAKANAAERILSACDVFRFQSLADTGVLKTARTYIPWAGYAVAAAFGTVILFILLLFFANHREPETGFYWIGTGALIASVLLLIPALWLKHTRWFDRFAVKTDHTFAAVTGYLYGGTNAVIRTAVWGILAAVGCYLIFGLLHGIRRRKHTIRHAKH
ncbi:MAG: hypothetical protein IKX57_04205 [Oscillospiraceae bacterium]|nr:hypothetical protein [Oscillospiraceae bacterium]